MWNANYEKSDGLEIVSIGKLYTGPWEKKYWSSSRGKDRYPFPVEFSAVRTENGIAYKMEISEGLKGPLFKISSSDGLSCSGRTPDIAWGSFQKKICSQLKAWHGKRFSGKIDGLEFFGFKNAFVQRLLRELVANVGANAANYMLPSAICMDASEIKDSIQPTDTLPYLEKGQLKGRRSRKEAAVTPTSISKTVLKGFPHRSGENITDASSCKKRRQEKYNEKHSSIIPIQKKDTKSSTSSRSKMKSVNLEPLVEEQELLRSAKDDLHSDAFHASEHLNVHKCFPSSSGNWSTVKEDGNLPEEENPVDQKNVSAECHSNSLVIEDENKRTMCPKTVCLSELVAPDSLDQSPEDSCKQKDIIATDMPISEVSVMKSEKLQEDEIDASISHGSNDKCQSDSSDHDIANPMLSILVPQAIPLLKTFSRRKRRKNNDDKPEKVASPEDEKDPNLHQNKKAQTYDKNHENYIEIIGVAPDSFDGYHTGSLGYTKPHLLPKDAVDDPTLYQNKKSQISDKDQEDYIQIISVAPDSFDGYDTGSLGNTEPQLLPEDAVDGPTLHQNKKTHISDENHEDYIQIISVAPDSFDGNDTGNLRNTKPQLLSKDAADDPTLHQDKKAKISDRNNDDYIQNISVAPDSIDGYDTGSHGNTKPHLLLQEAMDDPTLVCPDTCPSDSCFGIVEDSLRDTETTASNSDINCTRTTNSCKDSFCVGKEHACVDQDLSDSDIPASHPLIQTASYSKPHKVPDDAVNDPNFVCPETCPIESCFDLEVEDSVINTETEASKTHNPCTTSSRKDSLFVGKEPEHGNQDLPDVDMPAYCPAIQRVSRSNDTSRKIEVKNSSAVDGNPNLKHGTGPEDLLKLVACYNHTMPISSVLLSLVGNDVYICVLSGSSEEEDKSLFVYSTPITGEKRGRPFFVGHASVNLPKSEDAFGNKIAVDSSAIQFTPDGQDLVLLNSIRVPCCRERNMKCPCPACASDSIDKNAIKIVQLHSGFVSIIIKLKTAQPVRCILVCEPYYVVAIDDTGKLHLWVMNSRWSAQKDECDLPLPDNMPSQLVEIKKIPQSPVLIIGHNGFGEFCLWNLEKRNLVSRFSSPSISINKCVPICLFDWQIRGSFLNEHNQEEMISDILDATKSRLSGRDIQLAQPTDNEDGAVWLLVSTASHAGSEDASQSGGHRMNPAGCWRLALLAKEALIVGSPLDISATAAGASVGHGVIGRSDGVVYMWELSTGLKIGDLHHFKGSGVSCIATDSSNSALAVASKGGQLLAYINPRMASAKA